MATAWLMARFTRAELPREIQWRDITTVGLLSGIGFTVSLLIAELAFDEGTFELSSAKLAVLMASAVSAVLATIAILRRNRFYRAVHVAEEQHYTQELQALTEAEIQRRSQ